MSGSTPAILKVALEDDEKHGGILMNWWNGQGAARVLASDGDALLLERANGRGDLCQVSRRGRDSDATATICKTISRLHAHSMDRQLPEGLISLQDWFAPLPPAAAYYQGTLSQCARLAEALLRQQQEIVALHGDIHHGNILDFGPRGWLAVDPKYVRGERTYDYACLFCNPDATTALRPGYFQNRLDTVTRLSGVNRDRLLRWIVAYAGLKASRYLKDENVAAAQHTLDIAKIALAELE